LAEIPNLTSLEWEELVKRLTLYADSKLGKLYWRGVCYSKGGNVPGGVCPEDLAAEAIESFLDGSRNWNREQQPNFTYFLYDVIDSKVSHLVDSLENRTSRRMVEDQEVEPAYRVHDRRGRPDEIVANVEVMGKIHKTMMLELEKDEIAQSLFECYEAEVTKPQEIAELIGSDVQEVNNARKRLVRAASKVFSDTRRSKK
jgi:DNA-directed RNA polymerase specialized sigma24 family protein